MVVRKLIFDTSAINKLAVDVDGDAIIRTLPLLYMVGITETSLSEIIATKNADDRRALLNVLKRLLARGKCIMPFNWIIEEQAKAYRRDPAAYDWRRLNVRVAMAEQEIARQEFMHDLSERTRGELKQWDKQFKKIFRDAKPAFQNLFVPGQDRPSISEVTGRLLGEGGAHLEIGADLFERAINARPTVGEIKDFIERCPPFKALLLALCFSQYDRCIRDAKERSLGKAGRNDMFSAVYLSYSKVFVTNDSGHCSAMKVVAELAELDTAVLMYDQFKSGLVGLS
jgi:hypothetical protein